MANVNGKIIGRVSHTACDHSVHIDGVCMICHEDIAYSVDSMAYDSHVRYAEWMSDETDVRPVNVRVGCER